MPALSEMNESMKDATILRLRSLLEEARQYVSDIVGEEDMEVQTHSAALLKEIDAALSGATTATAAGGTDRH